MVNCWLGGAVSEDPKTYRSFGGAMLDDNLSIGINIRYLGRLLVGCGLLGWYAMHLLDRLDGMEAQILAHNEQIRGLLDKHILEEQQELTRLNEQLSIYEKELNINLNPLSWRKKNKK